MDKKDKLYNRLTELQKEAALLDSILNLLDWDEHTYLPPEGHAHRGEQLAYIAGQKHLKRTNPEIGELSNELETIGFKDEPDDIKAVNVREWRRDYDKATKIPQKLVEEITRTTSNAQGPWKEARKTGNFSLFEPWLTKVIELRLQEADCFGYKEDRYDALLDQYEPGMTTKQAEKILYEMKKPLVELLQKVAEARKKPDSSILHRSFPVAKQEKYVKMLSRSIGYDYDRGNLTVTVHPFCQSNGPSDIRITTRYNKNFFNEAVFGVIHEAGHAIYEQNLPAEHWGTPLGEATSLGFHESQSRMWENIVGRGKAFWEYWYPQTQKMFPSLKDVKLADFYFAINEVKPSYIRVEADEMTYNLHILLRFEIEKSLCKGEFKAADVPEVWNKRFKEYLGIDVPNHSQGCLQDIHWSLGLYGYFPTYSLGNLFAAQLWAKAKSDLKDIDNEFRNGDFTALKNWLTKNVHSQGRRYNSQALIKHITGNELSAEYMINYLKDKYLPLYGLNK